MLGLEDMDFVEAGEGIHIRYAIIRRPSPDSISLMV